MIRELLKKITPDSPTIHDVEHTNDEFWQLHDSEYYKGNYNLPLFSDMTYQQTIDLINAVADELGEPNLCTCSCKEEGKHFIDCNLMFRRK